MVGSGGGGGETRSKEAVGMMALHEALRNVCLNSDWTYSVFWTIRPRPRCRGGSGCKVGDDNGSLMLMWEDGFCRTSVAEVIDGDNPVRKAFSKMSIQLYNYGEGLMGKVASDKCHKWVFKEPSECEDNISNYWQSSFDALPPEWTDQFACGIQTIAVIQAGHGLLQLGSCNIIAEDLHFVLRMRHMFESLGYQSGFFISQLFPSSTTLKQTPTRPPPPIFNWSHHPPIASASQATGFRPSARIGLPPSNKDDTHLFIPQSTDAQMEELIPDHESDLKWPNGLSFFTALTGRPDDAKLLLGAEATNLQNRGESSANNNTDDFLSLESHSNKATKIENSSKFKSSFTLPDRMASSSSTSSLDHHPATTSAGMYSDIMETLD